MKAQWPKISDATSYSLCTLLLGGYFVFLNSELRIALLPLFSCSRCFKGIEFVIICSMGFCKLACFTTAAVWVPLLARSSLKAVVKVVRFSLFVVFMTAGKTIIFRELPLHRKVEKCPFPEAVRLPYDCIFVVVLFVYFHRSGKTPLVHNLPNFHLPFHLLVNIPYKSAVCQM